jgi:hypothetical protein
MSRNAERLAELVATHRPCVVPGAGISTESGIRTFARQRRVGAVTDGVRHDRRVSRGPVSVGLRQAPRPRRTQRTTAIVRSLSSRIAAGSAVVTQNIDQLHERRARARSSVHGSIGPQLPRLRNSRSVRRGRSASARPGLPSCGRILDPTSSCSASSCRAAISGPQLAAAPASCSWSVPPRGLGRRPATQGVPPRAARSRSSTADRPNSMLGLGDDRRRREEPLRARGRYPSA